MNKKVEDAKWILCPVCNGKTRTKIFEDTKLYLFPLFCPKCKHEVIINVTKGNVEICK